MTFYLDIHALQTLPPSNVNRDDSGAPKSATYGGVMRARVSSQSWKKAIRDAFRESNDPQAAGIRSRWVAKLIAQDIREINPEISEEDAQELGFKALSFMGIKKSTKRPEETDVLVFLSPLQIKAIAQLMTEDKEDKQKKAEAKKLYKGHNSYDLALFGRMVASDPGFNVEGATQFAHALGIDSLVPEFDFWSATDDHGSEEHAGAGNIGNFEFNSSTFYRFCSVNFDILKENLGSAESMSKAVHEFVHAFINTVPGGKQNSFAALTRPSAVIIELREGAPVSYAPAFEKPITRTREKSVSENGIEAIAEYSQKLKSAYGIEPVQSWVIGTNDRLSSIGEAVSLSQVMSDIDTFISVEH